jgi:Carboxypeptidase regulatory-like domain
MVRLLLIVALCASTALAQQAGGTLRGQVLDELGGAIVGATVVAVDAKGVEKTVTSNGEGLYTIGGLAPGRYTLRVNAAGFAPYENAEVDVTSGRNPQLNVTLKVTIEQTKVTVASDSAALSTEPENNAGAVVLKGADIEALPDDPDDLAAALQALAGPSAGPNGGQIFIDGFSNGTLPPKSAIREIRINSNPFSAEYDRLGFGRIEILTKPGTDKFRGSASFNFNDNTFNSRNPFSPNRPPFQSRQYGGNLSGPISKKKASFFFDLEKRDINDDAVINATILDANLNVVPFSQSVPTPNRRINFGPRIDYQINKNNTLVARYSYNHSTNVVGVGGFNLASREYTTARTENELQLTETAVINKTIVNETRFQFEHQVLNNNGNNSIPTIQVLDAFTSGGSQIGLASNTQNHWELTNTTSMVLGAHSLKFGARSRYVRISDFSPQNFGGTWTFSGGGFSGITSIQRYQLTLLGLQQGLSSAQIRNNGGGTTQFSISTGNPLAAISQFDFGGFVQDDWKVRPNLTLNLGLRYENQSNISSNLNFAPRLGFAWAPGAGGQKQAKTVVRGGFGLFYDRIGENLTLNADRFNGVNQLQYIVTDNALLNSFPDIPSFATLNAFQQPVTIDQLAKNLQAPYTMQSVISVERQLPHNLTIATSYIHARTPHLLRTRPINAPLPGTFTPGIVNSGVRPLGNIGNVFEYESSGRFDQNQFIVNVSERLSRTATINAFYVFSKANSDTDGTGTFPANPYDLTGEYGRASSDVRHRFVMFGNFRAPWGISLNPFVIVASGTPFNITLGRDLNGDTLYTERPAFAPAGVDCTNPRYKCTALGNFDLQPVAGEQIIPRNFGSGPGSVTANLRISKTFGFGKETATASSRQGGNRRGGDGGGARGPGGGNVMIMGGGGPRGGGGGGERGGGPGGFGGGGDSSKRYNLTFSLNFQNLLNHANLGRPVGNLSSSFFGMSTSTAGGFGGFGGGPGSGAYNRRVEASVRFSF